MIDLIGRPYRLGADGTDPDGALDCIHLVFAVHRRLGYSVPDRNAAWYSNNRVRIGRDIIRWWTRVPAPEYDGDVVVAPQASFAFAVFWEQGCLYINQHLKAVAWCPTGMMQYSHCFRSRSA